MISRRPLLQRARVALASTFHLSKSVKTVSIMVALEIAFAL